MGQVDEAGTPLLLNGTGVRSVAWFKGFVAGLYLMDLANAPEQAVNMAGTKRLQIRMLYTVPAGEFFKALNKGVARNVTPEQLAALQGPLAQHAQLVGELRELRKGDGVDLDHEPGRGLVMQVNGTLRGNAVPSDDLFAAVLASFVGKRPFDERLKAGLLGRKG